MPTSASTLKQRVDAGDSLTALVAADADLLSAQLQQLRARVFPPTAEKRLRKFMPGEAAKLIGISDAYLRRLSLEGSVPEAEKNGANWRDLMSAAVVVRSMLGVSPSAYQEACEVMGPENAATAMACVLERGGQINSAGGYLRDLTRKAARGEFSLGPMLMALMRANAVPGKQSA